MEREDLKGRKILIVEDDLSSRLCLNKILERTGAVIINAGDGQEAVDAVVNDADIALVLMDIQLPVMDGYEATKKIREIRKDIRIIAQTAYSLSGDMDNIIATGFDDYVVKPIYSGQLTEKLAFWLKKP